MVRCKMPVPNVAVENLSRVVQNILKAKDTCGSYRAGNSPSPFKALILASSVSGSPSQEELVVSALHPSWTIDVVSDDDWTKMSAADFASYSAIILGDPTCQSIGGKYIQLCFCTWLRWRHDPWNPSILCLEPIQAEYVEGFNRVFEHVSSKVAQMPTRLVQDKTQHKCHPL
jgi:hypothetical protein